MIEGFLKAMASHEQVVDDPDMLQFREELKDHYSEGRDLELLEARANRNYFACPDCPYSSRVWPPLRHLTSTRCQYCKFAIHAEHKVKERSGRPVVQIRRGRSDMEEVYQVSLSAGTSRRRIRFESDEERKIWRQERAGGCSDDMAIGEVPDE